MSKANTSSPQVTPVPPVIPEFDTTAHKYCKTCGTVQLLSHFANDKSKKDGKKPKCKGCQRAYRASPEGIKRRLASDRKYQAKPTSRFKKYQRSAAERGYEFLLTFKQFMVFWQKPCTHCGDPIETIGLDRVNSALPYQRDNVEPCCRICNAMKSDTDTLVWYKHMNKIMENTND